MVITPTVYSYFTFFKKKNYNYVKAYIGTNAARDNVFRP